MSSSTARGEARMLRQAGVAPGSRIVAAYRINFRQRQVRAGMAGVQARGFEQQPQGFVLLPFHTVELRQVAIGLRIGRLAVNPGALLFDVRAGFPVEREFDHLFAPEAHSADPTKTATRWT